MIGLCISYAVGAAAFMIGGTMLVLLLQGVF